MRLYGFFNFGNAYISPFFHQPLFSRVIPFFSLLPSVKIVWVVGFILRVTYMPRAFCCVTYKHTAAVGPVIYRLFSCCLWPRQIALIVFFFFSRIRAVVVHWERSSKRQGADNSYIDALCVLAWHVQCHLIDLISRWQMKRQERERKPRPHTSTSFLLWPYPWTPSLFQNNRRHLFLLLLFVVGNFSLKIKRRESIKEENKKQHSVQFRRACLSVL